MAWQTSGCTPLSIASEKGHVECLRVLLDGGAAINKARVGRTTSMARCRMGLSVRGCVGACVQLVGCFWMARVGGLWREVMVPMPYFGRPGGRGDQPGDCGSHELDAMTSYGQA